MILQTKSLSKDHILMKSERNTKYDLADKSALRWKRDSSFIKFKSVRLVSSTGVEGEGVIKDLKGFEGKWVGMRGGGGWQRKSKEFSWTSEILGKILRNVKVEIMKDEAQILHF